MTVTTATSRIEYAGDGSTTAFSVPFYFLANGDLKVYQADTLKTITTHYTVTGAGNPAGGTVTFVAAPGSSDDVVIYRDPAITQSTDYVENDPFPAESHETALDRLTMIAQRSRDLLTRAVRLPDSEADAASMTLPEKASRLSHVIGFDTLGNLTTYAAQVGTSLIDLANSAGSALVGFIQSGTGAVPRTVQDEFRDVVKAAQFGAVGDDVTDDTAAIQAAIDSVSTPVRVLLPAGVCRITSTIYLRRSGVRVVGQGFAVSKVRFVNASGGIAFAGDTDTVNSTAQYESCALEDFEVLSSGSAATDASIVVDLSSFSYGHFNIEAQTRRAGGVIYYGQGNAGVAPYYNHIESTGLFGGLDYTQTAFQFRGGAFGGGSNGPNANIIGPITRAASLDILADIRVGQGNLFHDISGESIGGAYFILGGNAAVSSGTSTGANGSVTFKDTGKSWTTNAYVNGAVQITAGTGQGQVRIIKTNTATQLTLFEPWATIPDATSQYSVYEGKAIKNKFVNLRAEGLGSLNPDFIYAHPGSNYSEFSQMSVESLGSGKQVIDYSGSVSNVLYGHRQVTFTHVFTTPGASANVNAYPRLSVWGGIKLAGDYVVEWVKAEVDYFDHGDTATVTLDVGGSAVGAGDQTLQLSIPNGESQGTALPLGTQKLSRNGTNQSMFLNLQTGAAFSAGRSVIVTVSVTLV